MRTEAAWWSLKIQTTKACHLIFLKKGVESRSIHPTPWTNYTKANQTNVSVHSSWIILLLAGRAEAINNPRPRRRRNWRMDLILFRWQKVYLSHSKTPKRHFRVKRNKVDMQTNKVELLPGVTKKSSYLILQNSVNWPKNVSRTVVRKAIVKQVRQVKLAEQEEKEKEQVQVQEQEL